MTVRPEILSEMMTMYGPLADHTDGLVPVHYNPDSPLNNKGIDFETGIFLKNFVEEIKPHIICELGVFRGYSTSWLILGNETQTDPGQVHSFEVFEEDAYGYMWYKRFNLPLSNFTYHHIPGGIWRHTDQIPATIDLLYHDTQHLLDPTRREMEVLAHRINPGGAILIDDMCSPLCRPMQSFFSEYFRVNPGWTFKVLEVGHGLGIARKKK